MADVGHRRLEHADSESAVEPPDSAARSDDLQRDPKSGKFVRSFSERLRTCRSGQSLERLWTKIRITKLQGKMKTNQRHLDFPSSCAMADLDQPSVVIQMNQIRLSDCRLPLKTFQIINKWKSDTRVLAQCGFRVIKRRR